VDRDCSKSLLMRSRKKAPRRRGEGVMRVPPSSGSAASMQDLSWSDRGPLRVTLTTELRYLIDVLGDTLQGHAISKELTQVRRQGAPRINFGCGSPAASLLYAQSTPGAVQRRVLGKNACSDCTALFSAARESGFTGFLETTRTPKPAFQQSAKATAGRPGIAGRFCPVDPFARKA